MKRIIIVAAILVAATAAYAAPAHASVRWPARCSTFKCVNAHLNQLHTKAKATNTRLANVNANLNALFSCLAEGPVDYNGDGQPLTATVAGQTPTAGWVLFDTCNTDPASAALAPRVSAAKTWAHHAFIR